MSTENGNHCEERTKEDCRKGEQTSMSNIGVSGCARPQDGDIVCHVFVRICAIVEIQWTVIIYRKSSYKSQKKIILKHKLVPKLTLPFRFNHFECHLRPVSRVATSDVLFDVTKGAH